MLKRLVAVGATVSCLSLLAACGSENPDEATDPGSSEASGEESESADGGEAESGTTCDYPEGGEAAKEVEPPASEATTTGEVAVTISTSEGDLAATLDADRTPCTVNNFVSLAEQSYFDDTVCHRLTTKGIYVLQCGDPLGTGMGGPGYTIPDEVDGSETYQAGDLAMAKTAAPNSGGSQFFLVYDDSSVLPPDYTVFGSVDEASVKLLQKIAERGTDSGAGDGAPKEEVSITGVTVG